MGHTRLEATIIKPEFRDELMIDNLAFLISSVGVVFSVFLMLRAEKLDMKQDKKNNKSA